MILNLYGTKIGKAFETKVLLWNKIHFGLPNIFGNKCGALPHCVSVNIHFNVVKSFINLSQIGYSEKKRKPRLIARQSFRLLRLRSSAWVVPFAASSLLLKPDANLAAGVG